MATKVNVRFVILLSTVLGAIVLSVVGFWYIFVQESPAELMHRGDKLMADGAPLRAVAYYGQALRDPVWRTDLELIDKYVAAIAAAPVDDPLTAEQHLDQLRGWMRRATELQLNDNDRLERFYALELQLARDSGGTEAYEQLYKLTDSRLDSDPGNPVVRKFHGIAQVHRLTSDTSDDVRQQAREHLEAAHAARADDTETLHHLARWHLQKAQRLSRIGGHADEVARQRQRALDLSEDMLSANPEDHDRLLKHLQILVHPQIDRLDEARTLAHDLAARFIDDPQPTQAVLMLADLLPHLEPDAPPDNHTDRSPRALPATQPSTTGIQKACDLLTAAVKAHPAHVVFRANLGRLLVLAGEHDAAIEQFKTARELSLAAPPTEYKRRRYEKLSATAQLADLLLERVNHAETDEQREQMLRRAEVLIEELETTAAGASALPMLQGKLALQRNEVARAALAFDKAIDRFEQPPRPLLLLSAQAHRRLNNWGTAVDRLQTALEYDPADNQVQLKLAAMHFEHGQLESAADHINVLLHQHPNDVSARQLKLRLHARRGEIDAATAIYEALPPDAQRNARQPMTHAYVATGQRDQALAMLDEWLERDMTDLSAIRLMIEIAPDQVKQRNLLSRARDAGANGAVLDLLAHRLEHDQEAATDELIQKLVEQQGDALQRALLRASIANRENDLPRLRAAIDQAVKINPEHKRVLEMRFELALHDEQWERAARLANTAARRNLDLAQGAFFHAQLAAAHGALPEASAHYRRALSTRPIHAEGWRHFGDVLSELNDLAAATDAYERAIEQQPDNIPARRGLASIFTRQGQHTAALEQLRQAIQHAPTNHTLINQYAAYEQAHGDPQHALALRRRLAQTHPEDQANQRSLALLLARNGHQEEAVQIAQRLIDEHGRSTSNVWTLAVVHRESGAPQQGEQILTGSLQQRGEAVSASDYILLARYRLSLGDGGGALEAYKAAMQHEDVNHRLATRELAGLLFSRGRYAQAATLLKQLYEANSSHSAIALKYGEALVRAGQLDEAGQIISTFDHGGASIALRGLLAGQRGDIEQGINLLTQAIEQHPTPAMVYLDRAKLRLIQDDQAGALADLRAALERDSTLVDAYELLADVHLHRGKIESVIDALKAILTEAPAHHQARLRLVAIYLSRNALDEAEQVLIAAAKLFPQDPTWPREQAALALRRDDQTTALEHSKHLVMLAPTAPNLARLAELQLAMDQPEAVLSLLRDHAGITNHQSLLQALRARALAMSGQAEQADRVFNYALKACRNVRQVVGVAKQLAATHDPDTTVQRFEQTYTFLPEFWNTIAAAAIDQQRNQPQRVIDHLQPLTEHIARADKATRWQYHHLLATALHSSGTPTEARAAYERLLALEPEHAGTLNNLAYLLVDELDAPAEALPLAEKAADLAPQNSQVLDTLGWTQYGMGQFDAARRTLERSLQLQPLPETALHLGQVYQALDNAQRARQQLELAVQLAEQSNKPGVLTKAKRQLKHFLSSSSRSPVH